MTLSLEEIRALVIKVEQLQETVPCTGVGAGAYGGRCRQWSLLRLTDFKSIKLQSLCDSGVKRL